MLTREDSACQQAQRAKGGEKSNVEYVKVMELSKISYLKVADVEEQSFVLSILITSN